MNIEEEIENLVSATYLRAMSCVLKEKGILENNEDLLEFEEKSEEEFKALFKKAMLEVIGEMEGNRSVLTGYTVVTKTERIKNNLRREQRERVNKLFE